MKLLTNPLVGPMMGVVCGLGMGIGLFWSQARVMMLAAKQTKAAATEEKRPDKPWDFWTLEIENLASELKDGKAAVAAREQALKVREDRVAADQEELKKTRAQIDLLRAQISGQMVELTEDESKNLKSLAKTYSAIAPKAVVSIIHEMDQGTVVKILSQMKSDILSSILEEMGKSADPAVVKQAAQLSEKLRLVKQPVAATAAN